MRALEPSFGGFNIEDVAAPECFELMRGLESELSVPSFQDDQFGTATVVTAGVINALKVVGRQPGDIRAVVNGVGAAGSVTIQMLWVWEKSWPSTGTGFYGAANDCRTLPGTKSRRRPTLDSVRADWARRWSARICSSAYRFRGSSPDMVRSMNKDPIVFGLANPDPEIMPDEARKAGAAIAASGRFDYSNSCNNVLAFPGLMRGAIDSKARRVSLGMCLAASRAIAGTLAEMALGPNRILPSPLDIDLHPNVAEAVAQAAIGEGLARVRLTGGDVATKTRHLRELVETRQRELAHLSANAVELSTVSKLNQAR
jgi:malate dehydrogenase (oxaloacetate-decarboxylating)